MPVYKMTVKGSSKSSIVKAISAAKARDHIVSAKPLSAEELADEIAGGATVESAEETGGSTQPSE